MAVHGSGARGDSGLQALFDNAEPLARTSAAAEIALICGLASVLMVPFTILFSPSALLGLVALAAGLVGLITTNRPDIAGSALTAFGIGFGLATWALIGMRYLGVDTAFGDDVVPWLVDRLRDWNTWLPQP
jgi:hypothetical protein